jgi:hypothetical protein
MADGQVVFEITGDPKNINQTVKQVTSNIQSESKKWDQAAGQATDNIEKQFASMAGNIVGKLAAAGIGSILLSWGKAAVSAASDLAEVQNVVDTVFGDSANKIEAWSKKAGTQFGLTETQAKKFTSTLGAMMKSSGIAGDEIVGMSTDLAGLAADMASFYNLDFDTAFEKIRSGISGETMPLKQLGINMSVANLEAFALAQGLEKTFSQMSQGEQTMLRYQYIMQATSDAQGDFAKTSDQYANGMRTLQTNLENIKTKLGNVLLDVVEPLVAGINALFPDDGGQKTHTVLDDFAGIDEKTEAQLGKITTAAQDARDLNNVLSDIATNNKAGVIGEIAKGANALKSNSVSNWNNILGALTNVNGLQNLFGSNSKAGDNINSLATALSGASVDTTKAEAWKTFLGALSDNADAVTSLTGTSIEETKEWLSGLANAANELDEGSANGWDKLLSSFLSGIKLDTPEGKQFLQSLEQSFLSMGSESEEAANGLRALGYDTDEIAEKQRQWLETCNRLIQTIPGLNEIINTETGEVKGGTQAVSDYVDEWEKAQKRLVYIKDLQQKQQALDKEFADFAGLEIDKKLAEKKAKEARDNIAGLISKYGLDEESLKFQLSRDSIESVYQGFKVNPGSSVATALGLDADQVEALNEASKAYRNAINKETEATDKYNTRKTAYDKAVKDLEERKAVVEELVGAIDEATDAEDKWSEKKKKTAKAAVETADTALKALSDYVAEVRNKIQSNVESIIKGFESVDKAGKELRDKQDKNAKETGEAEIKYATEVNDLRKKFGENWMQHLQKLGEESKEWKNLSDSEKEAYNTLVKLKNEQNEINKSLDQYKPESMMAGLQSQIDYMDEYLSNLEKAKKLGYSDELLASLSDGSAESAEYLAGLVNSGQSAEDIEKLNKLYSDVQKKKEEFTSGLTDQKLAVDEIYQQLLENAQTAVDALDLGQEASKNGAKTVEGLASGIASKLPDVKEAVDSILAQLARLAGFGINLSLTDLFPVYKPGQSYGSMLEGEFESGLDRVPFDGFLASLHEGEGILTAEENRVWQRFKNGQQPNSVDYDALGGVMRDNVRTGGNVYLDGRVVGSVISDQQGRSYRQLQRSGWQG